MLKRNPTPSMPLWGVYLALVAALFVGSLYVPRDTVFPPGNFIKEPALATLDIIKEITKLIVSLNTAMLTAAAAVTIKGHDWSRRWGTTESFLVMLVFVCGAVSYFGVYICQIRLLTMVSVGIVNPIETGVLWSLRLQYYGVILGVALLGLVFTRMLQARKPLSSEDPGG